MSQPPEMMCPCGSGKTFLSCHGIAEEREPIVQGERTFTHCYWLVAFVDLLGQKEAFLRTDYLPSTSDSAKVEAFLTEARASTGVILQMRKLLAEFHSGMRDADAHAFDDMSPDQLPIARRLQETHLREYRMSDGIVLACPLAPEPGHFPIRAVYEVVTTCGALCAGQLARGRPVRGGIDVGTGIEIEGELFGASLVKAYLLESTVAKYPRLAVGDSFLAYLQTSTRAPCDFIEGQFERSLAESILRWVRRDSDEQWIIDYAGPGAREMIPAIETVLGPAKVFAEQSRAKFRQRNDAEGQKLFDRYSMLVRYLESSGVL